MALTVKTLVKFTDEVRIYEFEFEDQTEIAGGQTLSGTPTVTATPTTGITLGSPSISGTKVQFQVSSGTERTMYLIFVTVGTSGGATLAEVGKLYIRPKEC